LFKTDGYLVLLKENDKNFTAKKDKKGRLPKKI